MKNRSIALVRHMTMIAAAVIVSASFSATAVVAGQVGATDYRGANVTALNAAAADGEKKACEGKKCDAEKKKACKDKKKCEDKKGCDAKE